MQGQSEDFSLEDRELFLSVNVCLNSLWICVLLWFLSRFVVDPVYGQPTARAFLPMLLGNFGMILPWTVHYAHHLYNVEALFLAGPQAILASGLFCDVVYLGYVSCFVGLGGIAFIAWVPLELVRCAKKFRVFELSCLQVLGAVAAGFLVGLSSTALMLYFYGRQQYRGLSCYPAVWSAPQLFFMGVPFWLLILLSVLLFRRVHLEMQELGSTPHVDRLKRKARAMRRYSVIALGSTFATMLPFMLSSLLYSPAISQQPPISHVLLSSCAMFSCLLPNTFMLWMHCRELRKKLTLRTQGLEAAFHESLRQRSQDIGQLRNRGVSLQFLHWFVREQRITPEMTVAHVMESCVKVATERRQCSFCELAESLEDEEGRPAVARPAYFVSHAWDEGFLQLLEQLTLFFRHTGRPGPIYFWIDIFAVNQHEAGLGADLARMHTVIEASDALLLTLNPWSAPRTLSRVWCLWEVFKALRQGREVVPIMPAGEECCFMQTMQRDRGRILEVLGTINVEDAQATVPGDKARILAEIEECLGCQALNGLLKESLQVFLQGVAVDRAVQVAV